MVDLGAGLRELARDAVPDAADAPGLWRQGRRRVRRRRVMAGAVVVVLVVLAGVGGLLIPQPTVVMPAGPTHAPALPKNVDSPSRWLASTEDRGPLGQLAVLGRSEGRHGDTAFGISATTGEYRFLDLPDRVRETAVSLSPNGRYVAYWITGPTRHHDFPPADGAKSEGGPVVEPVAGVAVYDSIDGSVTRHLVTSDYGLDVQDWGPELMWLDGGSVLAGFGHYVGTNASNHYGAYRWSPESDDFRVVADGDRWGRYYRFRDGTLAGLAQDPGDSRWSIIQPLTLELQQQGNALRLPYGTYTEFSRRGDRVVMTGIVGDGGIERVRTGVVGRDSTVAQLTPIGDIVGSQLLGWLAGDHVLVAALPGERYPESSSTDDSITGDDRGLGIASGDNGDEPAWSLYDVDLVSAAVHRLGTAGHLGGDFTVAQDLLGRPMVTGREPPHPLDPRVRDGLVAAGVALAIGMAALVVRARRRRG